MSVTINGTGTITGLSAGGLGASVVNSSNIVDATVASADCVAGVALTGSQTGSAPLYGCRAWANFNGATVGTNAPTSGGNVSTVQRNGAGDYTVTFTTAMQDANYAVQIATQAPPTYVGQVASALTPVAISSPSTTGFRFHVCNSLTAAAIDCPLVLFAVFR